MSPDVIATGVLGAVLALLGRVVFDWLKPKSGAGENGQAGDKTVSFWRMEFLALKNSIITEIDKMMRERNATVREIIRDELEKRGTALRQIVREEMDRRRIR